MARSCKVGRWDAQGQDDPTRGAHPFPEKTAAFRTVPETVGGTPGPLPARAAHKIVAMAAPTSAPTSALAAGLVRLWDAVAVRASAKRLAFRPTEIPAIDAALAECAAALEAGADGPAALALMRRAVPGVAGDEDVAWWCARDPTDYTAADRRRHGARTLAFLDVLTACGLRAGPDMLRTAVEAATDDDARVLERLLGMGLDAKIRDHDRTTLLHHARCGRAVDLLVKAGADVHARDVDGTTALAYKWHWSPSVARAFLRNGADPAADTPFFVASRSPDEDPRRVVKPLLVAAAFYLCTNATVESAQCFAALLAALPPTCTLDAAVPKLLVQALDVHATELRVYGRRAPVDARDLGAFIERVVLGRGVRETSAAHVVALRKLVRDAAARAAWDRRRAALAAVWGQGRAGAGVGAVSGVKRAAPGAGRGEDARDTPPPPSKRACR